MTSRNKEDQWKILTHELPDQIVRPIQNLGIQERIREASVESLNEAIDTISKTNDGQAGNIAIDMDVSEDAVHSLLKNITHAKFQTGDYYLRESLTRTGLQQPHLYPSSVVKWHGVKIYVK